MEEVVEGAKEGVLEGIGRFVVVPNGFNYGRKECKNKWTYNNMLFTTCKHIYFGKIIVEC